LNHDDTVDAADYVLWRKTSRSLDEWQEFFGASLTDDTSFDGDFNGDGAINAADYVMWRKAGSIARDYFSWRQHFDAGIASKTPDPDLNGDGAVNAADYDVWRKLYDDIDGYDTWRARLNQLASSAGHDEVFNVPEPCGLLSLLALALFVSRLRYRPPSR
jgi:hypothetical protein